MFTRTLGVAAVALLTAAGAVGPAPAASSQQPPAFATTRPDGAASAVDTDAERDRLYWLSPAGDTYRVDTAAYGEGAHEFGTIGLDPTTWRVKLVASDTGVYYLGHAVDRGVVAAGFLDDDGTVTGASTVTLPAGYTRVALSGDAEGDQVVLVASAVNPVTEDEHTLTWASSDHGTTLVAGEVPLTGRDPAATAVPSVAVTAAGRAAIAWTTGSDHSTGVMAAIRPTRTAAWAPHTLKGQPSAESTTWARAGTPALAWIESSALQAFWLEADPATGRTVVVRAVWSSGTRTWGRGITMDQRQLEGTASAPTVDDTTSTPALAVRRRGEILVIGDKFLVNARDGNGWVGYPTSTGPGDVIGADAGWLYAGPTAAAATATAAAIPAWVTGGPDLGSNDPWKPAPFDPDGPLIDITDNRGGNYIVGSRRARFPVYATVLDPARLSEDVVYQRQLQTGIGRLGAKYRTDWTDDYWGGQELRPFETVCGRGRARFADREPTAWTTWRCMSAPADDQELTVVRGRAVPLSDRTAYQGTLTVLRSRHATLRGIKATDAVAEVSVRARTGRRAGAVAVFVGKTRVAVLHLRRPYVLTRNWRIDTRGATGPVRLMATSARPVAVDWLATLASRR